MMRTEFELTLYDDEENRKKNRMLSRLEVMFDDIRNPLPEEYYYFSDSIPYGKKIRVTFEVVE